MRADTIAIDELTSTFFRAFDSSGGSAENIDTLYDIFLPDAIVVKNIDATPVVYTVSGFIEPRRALLSNGSVADFRERETSQRTELFGNVAQRFSRYTKSWTSNGEQCTGSGAKALHFVRTGDGWKIASLVWDDD